MPTTQPVFRIRSVGSSGGRMPPDGETKGGAEREAAGGSEGDAEGEAEGETAGGADGESDDSGEADETGAGEAQPDSEASNSRHVTRFVSIGTPKSAERI
nr:hypothetical protein [uncultured Actinoplanes sp.]